MDILEVLGNLVFFFLLLGGLSRLFKRRFQTQTSGQSQNSRQASHSQESKVPADSVTQTDSEWLAASESQPEHQQPLSLLSAPETPPLRKDQSRKRALSAQKRQPTSLLAFNRKRGYLQGIVLSEILGQPVSKRH